MTFSSNSTALTPNQKHTASGVSDNNRIKKLPPLLVNQLAAGEVVTRPASVVKELIENAIDAGAKNIDIRITQGGMGIIEVCDDGCGIHPDDMVMAVTRFATSKIADVAHLQGISTLGFRGEALAATAAVSRLTLTSCGDDSGIGRELNVAGILEDTPQMVPVVHPKGTTVTVKDLYFNLPARRGNLKSISTEYAHIEMVVKQLALVASDVSFTLWHNEKRRFHFDSINIDVNSQGSALMTVSESMQSAIMQSVLARLMALIPTSHDQTELFSNNNLQPVSIDLQGLRSHPNYNEEEQQPLSITGLLIPSSRPLPSSSYKLIYINGRLVKDRRIAQCIRECATNLATLDSLGYLLFFNLPKDWLNLNVHPSKQCIKIQNLANVMAHLEVGIRDALQLWQDRQQSATNQNNFKVSSHKSVNHELISNKQSNPKLAIEEPISAYEVNNSLLDSANSLSGITSNSNLYDSNAESTESIGAFVVEGYNLNKGEPNKNDLPLPINLANELRVIGIIAKEELTESLPKKINPRLDNDFGAFGYLLLIQSRQKVYLFSVLDLYAGLGVLANRPLLKDNKEQLIKDNKEQLIKDNKEQLSKSETLSQLKDIITTIKLPQQVDFNSILTEYAIVELTLTELACLLIGQL